MDLLKHGSHDQSSHGKGGSSPSVSAKPKAAAKYDESGSVPADTKISLIGGGTNSASALVESGKAPQKAFSKVGGWLPSGSIKIGDSFNGDGSQGPMKAPDWKSSQWKLDNWGSRPKDNLFG